MSVNLKREITGFYITVVDVSRSSEHQGSEVSISVCPLKHMQLQTPSGINNYQTPFSVRAVPLVDCRGQRRPEGQWDKEAKSDHPQVFSQTQSSIEDYLQWLWKSFLQFPTAQVRDRKKLNGMSSLKEICGGLPLDPLPPNRGRDPNVPHAPTRTPNLTAEEERVS